MTRLVDLIEKNLLPYVRNKLKLTDYTRGFSRTDKVRYEGVRLGNKRDACTSGGVSGVFILQLFQSPNINQVNP